MSTAKVNGGRRLDASYEAADGGDEVPAAGRSRRNPSLKGNTAVVVVVDDHDASVDEKRSPEPGPMSSNSSLDRPERHRNPIQKAFSGVRHMLRNFTAGPSPTAAGLHRRLSLEGDRDHPGTDRRPQAQAAAAAAPAVRQRTRANSESRVLLGNSERSATPTKQQQQSNVTLPNGRPPGVTGIHNHGNSCFLNAVIQCLSNTGLLMEYLLGDELQDRIERSDRNCAVTRQLVALIESLWTGTYDAEISYSFKQTVGECAEQYSGMTQNDAQEFLLWLLDKVNEELCCFAEKDSESASRNVQGRNSSGSIVFDLFEAKYRSTLTCPSCQQQSNTYDPFLSVSLPIQLKNWLPVYVTVAFMKPYYRQTLFGFIMNTDDTVAHLRRILSRKTGINERQLLITQIHDGKFQSTLLDSEILADFNSLQFIYAIELYDDLGSSGNTFDGEFSGTETVCIVAVNRVRDGTRQNSRFGGPFVINVSRDSTMLQLRGFLLGGMSFMVPKGCMEQVILECQFLMRISTDTGKKVYLSNTDEYPLYAVSVDEALTQCSQDMPPHIMLVLEWRYSDYKQFLTNTHPPVHCDPSYKQMKTLQEHTNDIDLEDCFSAFTQQEELGDEDTWLCPNCHRHQHGTTKSLNLCSLPDIMIVHLKRFRQDGDNRSKLNTLIRFPITDLDMTDHLTKGQSLTNGQSDSIRQSDYIYDLYGVCNHEGDMSQGHYKAVCKNPLNGRWYVYDDAKVSELREDQIVTRMAYLLFYRRQNAKSRSHTELRMQILQLLVAHGIRVADPKPIVTSKNVTLNDSSVTTPSTHSVRSLNHVNNTNNSFRNQMNSSFTHAPRTQFSRTQLPRMSNSFHASLRKPPSRRIPPTAHWAMDRRFVASLNHSTMTRSRTHPLQQKTYLPTTNGSYTHQQKTLPPTNGNKMVNGKVKDKSVDGIGFRPPPSVLTDSAILDAVTKPTNTNKPKLMFKKAQNSDASDCSNGDAIKRESLQRPLDAWLQKAEKFVQESSV